MNIIFLSFSASILMNIIFITFAYDYLKKFRARISKFRTKVRQLFKKNKLRYDIKLQRAVNQTRREFEEQLRKEEDLRISAEKKSRTNKKRYA